jgi:hypothetical protein
MPLIVPEADAQACLCPYRYNARSGVRTPTSHRLPTDTSCDGAVVILWYPKLVRCILYSFYIYRWCLLCTTFLVSTEFFIFNQEAPMIILHNLNLSCIHHCCTLCYVFFYLHLSIGSLLGNIPVRCNVLIKKNPNLFSYLWHDLPFQFGPHLALNAPLISQSFVVQKMIQILPQNRLTVLTHAHAYGWYFSNVAFYLSQVHIG